MALEFITREAYERSTTIAAFRHYFAERWVYASKVIGKLRTLDGAERVLEVGPGPECRTVVVGADTLDFNTDVCAGPTYFHDAGVAPWPIEDKAYDVVLALQVFEHLKGRQREAYGELKRVARRAILTLPFKCRSKTHNIGWDEYKAWFGGEWVEHELINAGLCKKIMFYFNFEP